MNNLYSFEFLYGGEWISAVAYDEQTALYKARQAQVMLNGGGIQPHYKPTKTIKTKIR